ncbi:unnamed protein product [Ambrosiozyma monospora]|uniref:Unnamed protein product n=1 Tax=Ambrosiozyma monospora TaxID=43982 RepID=A0A9W7DIB5_AMBMO|nr:unnamed protein product [Ambrosiozyma monospora]
MITPDPVIVELDLHEHGKDLQQLLGELTGRKTVPNLMIKGVSRGGGDDIAAYHANNELLGNLKEWVGSSAEVEKVNAPSNS